MSKSGGRLRREAGLFQVIAYGIANIIGAGIYVLVGAASGLAGGAIWLAFFIGAFVAAFTGISYAELSAMYPKAASEYEFLGKAYGNRLLAFLSEWTMLITEIVAAATVSLGFAEYMQVFFGFPPVMIAAALLLALTVISIIGIRQSLRLNMALSVIAIVGLLVVIAAGIPKLGSVNYMEMPNGINGIFGAAILVFFAYIGFDNVANLAEETKDPGRTIPKALIISVILTTILYVLVGIAAVSLVPWSQLASSNAPLALASSETFGPVAYYLLTVAALFTTLNTDLVLLIVGSRIVYGMARKGVLPRVLGSINDRTGTPYIASIAVLLVALAFLSLGKIGIIAKITSFGSLLTFALVNLALIQLRKIAPGRERPFKAPFSIGWLPITALIGLVSCLALLTQFDPLSVALGMALPVSGIVIYIAVNRGVIIGVDRSLIEHAS